LESKINILLKYNANVNVIGKDGETALMLAIRKRFYNIIEPLLYAGANVDIQFSRDVRLPITHLSVRNNFNDYRCVLPILLEYNVNIHSNVFYGRSLMDVAKEIDKDMYMMLQKHIQTVNPLKNIVIRSLKESHKAEFKKHGGCDDVYRILTKFKDQKEDRLRTLSLYKK